MKTIAKTQKKDVYQMITDLIIEKLERGIVPWRKVWDDNELPMNYVTKKFYHGINMWLLMSEGYNYPYFLTFKQAQNLGGKIKKGVKGLPVCYWNFNYFEKQSGRKVSEQDAKKYPAGSLVKKAFLRYYTVFNVSQAEGIEFEPMSNDQTRNLNPIESCEKIIASMINPPLIKHEISEAFYSPSSDYINMPDIGLFESAKAYYAVLFHELVHATGHQDRLNRREVVEFNEFGSEEYSREELTAEMGASFLCNHSGIMDEGLLDNSAAYIKVWLDKLKSDKKLLIEAASKAQKAVSYILCECPF